jgi:septal ring factor EnvC (AmiA/AmiB activator)
MSAKSMSAKPRLKKPILAALVATLFLALALTVASGPAVAEQNQGSDAIAPVEEFSKQVEEFKKSYPDLNKKIEDSAKSIDAITDVEQAQKEIEELRAAVSGMLGAVADNGPVSQLGAKALAHAQAKIKELEQGGRFTQDERDFLLDQWRKLAAETERATNELDSARNEFAELLRMLQTREDFVQELLEIRRATEALNVMRQLTHDIRDASNKLKTLIGGIKAPGA